MEIKTIREFKRLVGIQLFENIIPFWLSKTIDHEYGGFYGRISNNLNVEKEAKKGLILHARILWTFSRLYRIRSEQQFIDLASYAYKYLCDHFFDEEFGGYFWMLDYRGKVIDDKKKIYGQAFMVYALAEYYAATQDNLILDQAVDVFKRIEQHNYDQRNHGYFETSNRNWVIAEEMRLSEVDMNEMKSMNTHLHLMEAYANLFHVWPDDCLRKKLTELIDDFETHILDRQTLHFKLFFDEEWHSKSHSISFGHDIEGSWLLCEAAEILDEEKKIRDIREIAVKMARITAKEGLSDHFTIYSEKNGNGKVYRESHWWQQAEAVVGFISAFEISGDDYFLILAMRCWQAIEEYFVDRKHQEWFYRIDARGRPDLRRYKVSEWKGPYHNGRACMEILNRLEKISEGSESIHDEKSNFRSADKKNI